MHLTTRSLIFIAMVLMTTVSIWTTYVSLFDSILPSPTVGMPLWNGLVWNVSLPALGLSLAIGLMLFGLKIAIMYEHKHLNILGLLGLMVVAFISITFNMDVLYRTADREFFIKYSDERMRSSYQAYLGQVQRELDLRRDQLLRATARQEGELDAEVRGLRAAPAGYGQRAKQEEYRLDILRRTNAVEIERIEAALARKAEADRMMVAPVSGNLDQVMNLQAQVRGAARDAGAAIGLPLPPPVRLESPLFVVVARLFDWQTVGLKEFFFLAIAVFLDLGDIIGYSLVPNRRPRSVPALPAPEPKPGPAVPTRVVEAGA